MSLTFNPSFRPGPFSAQDLLSQLIHRGGSPELAALLANWSVLESKGLPDE